MCCLSNFRCSLLLLIIKKIQWPGPEIRESKNQDVTLLWSITFRSNCVRAVRKIMNESTIGKSAAASGDNPETRIALGVRFVILCAVLVFANGSAIAFAESSCPGIHVKVLNIRDSDGTVDCALFESPVGFPAKFLFSATNVMVIKVRKTQARCDFEDIPPGTYALAVIHDENMNGKLDTNLVGVPTEGYGFSNNATALLHPPSFSDASFQYDGRNMELTISMHY